MSSFDSSTAAGAWCRSSSCHVLLRPLVSIRISNESCQLNLYRTPYTSNHHQQYFNIFYCEIPFCLPIMMKKKQFSSNIFLNFMTLFRVLLLKIWFFMGIYYYSFRSLAVLWCLCSILLCKLWVYDDISLLILTFSFCAKFSLLFDFFTLCRFTTFYALDHTQILLKFYGWNYYLVL